MRATTWPHGAAGRLAPPVVLAAVVAVGGLVARVGVRMTAGDQLTDDAYIFFRYARHAIEGHGLAYNVGEQVYGYTSPLYTLLLVPAAWVAGPGGLPVVALLLGLGCWVALAGVAMALAERSMPVPWLAGAVLAGSFALVLGSLNGMETGLFVLTLFLSVLLLVQGRLDRALVAAALCALTRPEGFVAAALVLALLICWHRSRWPLRGTAGAAGLVGAWMVAATLMYGSPVPQSLVAKAGAPEAAGVGSALRTLGLLSTGLSTSQFKRLGDPVQTLVVLAGVVVAVVVVIDAVRLCRARSYEAVLPLWFLAIWSGYVVAQPVNIWSWYTAPTAVVAAWSVSRLLGGGLATLLRRSRAPRRLEATAAVGVVLVLVASLAVTTGRRTDNLRAVVDGLAGASATIERELPVPRTVMVGDIGIVGWELASTRIFDLSGLVTPAAAASEGDELRSLGELVREHRPDAVVLSEDARGRPSTSTGSLRRPGVLADDLAWFEQRYRLVAAPVPGEQRGRWVWMRRDLVGS